MIKSLITDPTVLICSAIIIIGLIALVWTISKFRSPSEASFDAAAPDNFLPVTPAPPAPEMDFGAPPIPTRAPVSEAPPVRAPAVDPGVAERLESMTQRLAEMQNVLTKQASAAPQGAAANVPGGVGQGFSPETIDKLLKIIGNVMQQVDILQKNLNPTK